MSEKKGTTILLAVIAISALGLSGYTLVDNLFFSTATPDTGLNLVGLWDALATNKEYAPYNTDDSWLIEFSNNQFKNSNYIEVSNSNTRFKLLKEGFYKITLLITWSGVDANAVYWAVLLRNNIFDHYFARIAISANPSSPFYQIESSIFASSTSFDNFTIRCYCSGDTSFEITSTQTFNQLSIEYNK